MHTGSTAEERRAPLLASSKLPPAEIPTRLPVPRMPSRSDVEHWSHELSQSSLASNDSGYTQQPWLPEDLVLSCMLCKRPFHLMRWTHHCRDCGGVVFLLVLRDFGRRDCCSISLLLVLDGLGIWAVLWRSHVIVLHFPGEWWDLRVIGSSACPWVLGSAQTWRHGVLVALAVAVLFVVAVV